MDIGYSEQITRSLIMNRARGQGRKYRIALMGFAPLNLLVCRRIVGPSSLTQEKSHD